MPIDASELRVLAHQFNTVEARLLPKVRQAVSKTLLDIEADAKILAPVDTGNLQNSISHQVDADGMGGEVGPTADYGLYVEAGTSRMAPQPYLGPAFDRRAPGLEKALAQLEFL